MDYEFDYKNYSPWIKVDDVLFEDLGYDDFIKQYKKNEVIYSQGSVVDYVYIIIEGRVRIYVTSKDGSEQSLVIMEKGTVFGDLSAIDGLPNYTASVCIVDSSIFRVPKDRFLRDLHSNQSLNKMVINSFARKVRVLSNNLANLSFSDASSRVKVYLLKFAFAHGNIEGDKCLLNLKFTHQEMANLTGLSRVAVSNVMSSLINEGVLSKNDGYIVINDMKKLYT